MALLSWAYRAGQSRQLVNAMGERFVERFGQE
jgi:hypothetical protein